MFSSAFAAPALSPLARARCFASSCSATARRLVVSICFSVFASHLSAADVAVEYAEFISATADFTPSAIFCTASSDAFAASFAESRHLWKRPTPACTTAFITPHTPPFRILDERSPRSPPSSPNAPPIFLTLTMRSREALPTLPNSPTALLPSARSSMLISRRAICYNTSAMQEWDDFKRGFAEGLKNPSGPDGCADGPKSVSKCLIWLAFIVVSICILGWLRSVWDIPVR